MLSFNLKDGLGGGNGQIQPESASAAHSNNEKGHRPIDLEKSHVWCQSKQCICVCQGERTGFDFSYNNMNNHK